MELHDVIIIGGGPAGLSAALLLGRARRKVVVVDAGQPRNQRARQVNGYLGLPDVSPFALRAAGQRQAIAFGVRFVDGLVTEATCPGNAEPESNPTTFEVRLADGKTLLGRKLIFATGIRDELPQIPGFIECYGSTVHHCPYCDGWEHRDACLVAFSESIDSAIALAKTLLRWSNRVTAATSGSYLSDDDKDELHNLGIQLREPRVTALEHEVGKLQTVIFSSGERTEADALFFSAQSNPCCRLPIEMGCKLKERDRVETTDRQGTGIPGVFLAGDADGDVQFAVVGAAEGAIAGMAVNKELQQEDLKFRKAEFRPTNGRA